MLNNKEVIGAEVYNPPEDKNVRWAFDYTRLIWEIRAKLKGGYLVENKDGEWEIKYYSDNPPQLMSDEGIEHTIALINAFVDGRVHGMSIYDNDRIMMLCRDLFVRLSQFYYVNMERYDLTPEKANIVIRIIISLFESNLRKSLGGTSLRLIGSTEKIIFKKDNER